MKTHCTVALAMLAGVALGAIGVNGLNAQDKTPGAYVVVDISAINDLNHFKTLFPIAEKANKEHGVKFVIRTEKITALDGTAPKRFVVLAFDSMDKANAWHKSAEMKQVDDIRMKTTTSRSFIADGTID